METKRIQINKTEVIIMTVMLLLFLSCSVKKHIFCLARPNPTEYVYNMPLEELRTLVINDFQNPINPDVEEILCRSMRVMTNAGHYDRYDSIYLKTENIYDLILQYPIATQYPFLGYSDVYYKKNMPLLYYVTAFHLHFEPIDIAKTRIKVYVINPQVVTGNEIICIPSHCGYRWKSVEPTTIEEYKILLRIGKLAEAENMSQLNKPCGHYHVPRWP